MALYRLPVQVCCDNELRCPHMADRLRSEARERVRRANELAECDRYMRRTYTATWRGHEMKAWRSHLAHVGVTAGLGGL